MTKSGAKDPINNSHAHRTKNNKSSSNGAKHVCKTLKTKCRQRCLLVGKPWKKWARKPGQQRFRFSRIIGRICGSEVEFMEQNMPSMVDKVLNLEFAFALDQIFARP